MLSFVEGGPRLRDVEIADRTRSLAVARRAALTLAAASVLCAARPAGAGLVAYWNFDNAGAPYADTAPDGAVADNGTVVGTAPDQTPGCFGNGLQFPGAASALNLGSSPDFNASNYTVSAWLWVDPAATSWRTAMGSWFSGSLWMHFGKDSGAVWGDYGGAQTSGGTVSGGQWFHVVSVRGPATNGLSLWVNGDRVAQATGAPPAGPGANNVWLGSKDGVGNSWWGKMDDVAFWNASLTPTGSGKVRALYTAPTAGIADLAGYDAGKLNALFGVYDSGTPAMVGPLTWTRAPALAGHSPGDVWADAGVYYVQLGDTNGVAGTLPLATCHWRGETNGVALADWVSGNPAATNWFDPVAGGRTAYVDGAAVVFDDALAAAGAGSVNLASAVAPAGVAVSSEAVAYTFRGNGGITGATGLTKSGAGTLTVQTTNDYRGGTTINGGTLRLAGANDRLPTAGAVALADAAGARLDLDGLSQTIASLSGGGDTGGDLALGSGTLTVNQASAAAYNGVIGGSGGFVKSGVASLTLGGTRTNTFTGALTASAGTLTLAKPAGVAAAGGDVVINPASGWIVNGLAANGVELAASEQIPDAAVLHFTGSDWSGFRTRGFTETIAGLDSPAGKGVLENVGYGEPGVSNDGTLILAGAGTYAYSGYIRNNDTVGTTRLNLTKSGNGTQTLSGAYIEYSGLTTVNGGKLVFANTTGLGATVISNAATVAFYADSNSGYGVPGKLSGSGLYEVDGPGGGTVYQNRVIARGNLSDNTGPINVINSGKLWLDRAVNAIGDAATVNVGVSASFHLYSASGSDAYGAFQVAETIGGLAGAGSVYGMWVNGTLAPVLTLGGGDVSAAFSGTLADAGAIAGLKLGKVGAGTQTFSGANIRHAGATTVNGGTLALQDTTGFSSPTTVNPGATLRLNKTVNGSASRSKLTGTLTGAGTLDVNHATAGIGGGWVIFSSAIVGLSNFTGRVNVNAGVLSMDNLAGAWSGNPALHVAAGGLFAIRAQNIGVDALTGDGDVINSWNGHGVAGDTLTVGANNGSGTFSGVIHGSVAAGGTDATIEQGIVNLVKAGTGTQTLSGTNTYGGATTVNGGTLLVNGAHTAAGAYTVASGGTLGGGGTIAGAVGVDSGGTLAPGGTNGTAVLHVNNNVTLAGGAVFHVNLAGPAVGAQYDQLALSAGALQLDGTTLSLAVAPGYAPAPGAVFTIVSSASPTSGAFADLPAGAALTPAGSAAAFVIGYDNVSNPRTITLSAQALKPGTVLIVR